MKKQFNNKGFTIAELFIATIILAILIMTASGVYTNFYNAIRNVKSANMVYEEARFTMERIVKEIRSGTIDYEEYYNQKVNFRGLDVNQTLGQNYCQYSRQFTSPGPDGKFGTFDDESTGINAAFDPTIDPPIQDQLFLINNKGDKRTYIRRTNQGVGSMGKVGLLKLEGKDYGIDHIPSEFGEGSCKPDLGEKDGLIDTWLCKEGFNCFTQTLSTSICSYTETGIVQDHPTDPAQSSFVDITPGILDIVDLKFTITPSEDPYKAYNDPAVQIQPHVGIKLIARASPDIASEFGGKTPTIVLESTVSARSYREIVTECNLKECIDGDTKNCPAQGPLLAGAFVTCSQNIWPICTDDVYMLQAAVNVKNAGISADGKDHNSIFAAEGGRTFYESQSEFGSCADMAALDRDACKTRRCSDGFDNDGNGKTDIDDPTCLFQLCNNGIRDEDPNNPGEYLEECRDIGGLCYFRPKRGNETQFEECFDGYDNDCDGVADEFDQNCIDLICSNGLLDPAFGEQFLRSDYDTIGSTGYLLNINSSHYNDDLKEIRVDIGGLCENTTDGLHKLLGENEETGSFCYDDLDNDDDGLADEFDSDCVDVICSNNQKDCNLAPISDPFSQDPTDYLGNYSDDCPILNKDKTDNDEKCIDIGGICGSLMEFGESKVNYDGSARIPGQCTDGLDNDCDGDIDGADFDCCSDEDIDGFVAISATCPKETIPLLAIDCDDDNDKVNPDALEDCGDPADNNCSSINNLYGAVIDTGTDSQDEQCCTDLDGDGFGAEDAYIYKGNPSICNADLFSNRPERTPYDCWDDPDFPIGDAQSVHPNILEETVELCRDGINNNCRFSSITDNPRIDHIDMYANEAGGIAQAFADRTFEPECCDSGAMEICDDSNSLLENGGNSDENCNGKAGINDDYCRHEDGFGFRDNLTTTQYVYNPNTTAVHNSNAGTFTLTPNSNEIQENQQAVESTTITPLLPDSCPNSVSLIKLLDDPNNTYGDDILYYVSNDGGTNYEPIIANAPLISFFDSSAGRNRLRWKAAILSSAPRAAIINSVTLEFSCN